MQQLFQKYPVHARCAALLLLLLLTALTLRFLPDGLYTYCFNDAGSVQIIRTTESDPTAIPDLCQRPLLGNDTLEILGANHVTTLTAHRSRMVTVHLDGETIMTECAANTVADVLSELNVVLDEDDYVRPSPDTLMQEGMDIQVVRVETRELTTENPIPFQTLKVLDLSLDAGETRVDDEGADGLSRTTTHIVYENGEVAEYSQTTEIIRNARAQRISTGISHAALEGSVTLERYQPPKAPAAKPSSSGSSSTSSVGTGSSSSGGSKPSSSGSASASYSNAASVGSASGGVLTTSSGATYTYTKVLSCSATAYTTEGYTEKHNASGNIARVGTVAVDPKVIPLGTALYIVTDDGEYIYGYCIAEDTGGAVKGNIVDLFFNTLSECYSFGRRNCTVYVLG